MDRPKYKNRPIKSVAALCKALGKTEGFLRSIADRASRLYRGPTPKLKKNGVDTRDVYDTKYPLKSLLRRINHVLLKHVDYPAFLHGSLSGRDPVSNAQSHEGSSILIAEDIAGFFDYIDADRVFSVWAGCLRFDEDSAELLTKLTTKDGYVCQGAPTSSYLANLALWDIEGEVVRKLRDRGFRYSRYVDDIAVSSKSPTSQEDVEWVIAQLYAMMGSRGFKPKRSKHSIQTGSNRIDLMRFGINRTLTLSPQERSSIRAHLHAIEDMVDRGEVGDTVASSIRSVQGRLGRLKKLHPMDAEALTLRLEALKSKLC